MTKRKINILGRILQIFFILMVLGLVIAAFLAFNPFLSLYHKNGIIFVALTLILISLCGFCFKSVRKRDSGLDVVETEIRTTIGVIIAVFLVAIATKLISDSISSLFK